MGFIFEERSSDSHYIETVTRGYSEGEGSTIRPAESHWHMVFVSVNGSRMPIFVGPLTSAGVVPFGEEAEILWIKFRLGSFMPHLPVRDFLDVETTLPGASSRSFWLKGSAWEVPDYDNAEAFVDRLVREDVLVCDPVVDEALQGHLKGMPARTVRQRFLRATGLSQGHIYQIERAKQAAGLLQRGVSILDTVFEAGYYDQPHLTRSLQRWIGRTPAQILRSSKPDKLA
jgi:AraC-like DNA-binding protein